MRLDADTWFDPNSNGNHSETTTRLHCPSCSSALPREAMAAGQRLARCRRCGQLLRRVVGRQAWPNSSAATNESPATAFAWGNLDNTMPHFPQANDVLEIAPSHPYPALPCPYCEHLNRDNLPMRPGQQYCANCGADLKKRCLNCEASLSVLDYFCTHCRTDQERLKYEIEAVYWQRFNEGKRLAQLGRWQDAERELSLFFNPSPNVDRDEARRARQIYVGAIAPGDAGVGLALYNEAVEGLRLSYEGQQRKLQQRKIMQWSLVGVAMVGMAIFSALSFGSWWFIFIIGPAALLVVIVLLAFLLGSIGLG